MKKMDFVARLGLAFERMLAERRDEDYMINPPQMEKYLEMIEFLTLKCKENHGKMEHVSLVPKEEFGDISALFRVFDLSGESLIRFSELLKHCSAFGIDTLTDGRICICATVPNVHVRKEEVDYQERTIDDEDLLDDDGFFESEEFLSSWEPVFREYGV